MPVVTASISWDEAKLKELIRDKLEENLTLEYKAAGALAREDKAKLEITKDVSAMANSAGGILIYGLAEFHNAASKHLAETIDPINRNEFSKEWLENIISQIRPRISDLKIYPVQLASNSDDVAYVIEIPQSSTAHQSADFRYYRRYNFQSTPMLDHEVRDVMNRKVHPRISVGLKFVLYPHIDKDGAAGALVAEIKNESNIFARYVAFVIHSPLKVRGHVIVYDESTIDDGDHGSAHRLLFSNHLGAPLFPQGMLKQIFKFQFGHYTSKQPEKHLDHFRWVAFADAMPMQSGTFTVDEVFLQMK